MGRALPPGVGPLRYPLYLLYRFFKRNLARLVALLLLVVAILLVTSSLLLRSETFARAVIERALPAINGALPGEILVGSYSGALGDHFVLEDLVIKDETGDAFITARRLTLDWEFWDLLAGDVSVGYLRVEEPRFVLKQRPGGGLNVVRAFAKPGPPKPKKAAKWQGLPLDILVANVDLERGAFVFERPDGHRIVDVDGIELRADYSLRGLEHDAVLRALGADLHAPISIPRAEISGSARMDDLELDLDQLLVRWLDDALVLSGTLGDVSRLQPDLKIQVDRFDLADIRQFAAAAPIKGVVAGDLRLTGSLEDLRIAGPIRTAGGARIEIVDAGVGIVTPLAHHANLRLEQLDLLEIIDVAQLPPPLTGSVRWTGEGTGPSSLRGEARVALAPIDYQEMILGPTQVVARIEDWQVHLDEVGVGLAGGTVRPHGVVDLGKRCFDLNVGGDIGSLAQLERRIKAPFTRGALALDIGANGCWGTEESVVALATRASVGVRDLGLESGGTSIAAGTIGWELDVDVPKGGGKPSVRGPVTVEVSDLVVVKQVVSGATVRGTLEGDAFEFVAEVESGDDLGARLTSRVDWGGLPEVIIDGRELSLRYRTLNLKTQQEFRFRLRDGAIEASGLVAKTESQSSVILQGTVDPKGETSALFRLLSFDLIQTDAFLPEDGRLSGELQDLTVKLDGTLANPSIGLRTRLRNFATRGRGPLDLDLDLALKDSVLSGTAKLSELIELEIGQMPVHFRLDGKGGLPVWVPEDAPIVAEVRLLDGPLSRFEPGLGRPLPPHYVGGRVRGVVTIAGTTTAPTLEGGVALRDLLVDLERREATTGEVAAGRSDMSRQVTIQAAYSLIDGEFSLRDARVRTNADGTVLEIGVTGKVPLAEHLMGRAGPRHRRVEGLPPILSELTFDATLRRLPMDLVHLLAPASEPLSGALTGSVALTGALATPKVVADIRLLGGRIGDRSLKKAALTATIDGGRLVSQLEVVPAILPEELDATATGDSKGKPERGAKKKKGAERRAPDGAGSGAGNSSATRRSAVAGRDDASLAAQEKARALLAADPDAGRLIITATAPLPLALDGSRPFKEMLDQPGLVGKITSEAFPLPVLLAFVPGAMEGRGELVLAGTVTGSLLTPRPDVALRMTDGRFQYLKSSVSYEGIDIDVALSPEAILVREVSLDTLPLIRNPLDLVFKPNVMKDNRVNGRKSLTISGTIALDGWKPTRTELDVTASRLWGMYTPQIKAQLDASLTARGHWPDLVVRGRVDMDDVDIDLGQEATGRSVESMQLPDNLYVHRETTASGPGERTVAELVRRFEEKREPGVLDLLDLDVMVHLGNKVHGKVALGLARARDDALRAFNLLGSIEPDVNLGGDVRVVFYKGRRRFEGAIEVTRDSTLTVLTKKFEIVPGSKLTLVGDLFDSQLDVEADFPSAYGTITVQVRETLAAPSITFTSEELPDQSDMMSVLIVGKPMSEVSNGEGQGVTKTISTALAGFGTKLLGKYTPLDKFDVDLGDDMSSGSVEAGKAVTPELFLLSRFRWGVEDERENHVEAEVQWRPRQVRRFAIEGHIGDRLAGGVQIVWRVLY